VSCRAAAGDLTDAVAFALAVSFEIEVAAGVQVYDEVRARLVARVQAAA
jgi:hypothetical protein